MKTEASKTFEHGFVLTEQELRRIVDTATRKMREAVPDSDPRTLFEITFRNGTVTDSDSLDDVLSLENFASRQIVGLSVTIKEKNEQPQYFVDTRFIDLDEGFALGSIGYTVRGIERDWVLVTASELEERIAKVKCFSLGTHSSRRRPRPEFFWLAGVFVGIIFMFAFLAKGPTTTSDTIESRWKAGTLRDPIEAIIIQQKGYEKDRKAFTPSRAVLILLGIPLTAVVVLWLGLTLLNYLYPPYVFSWGDYTKVFDKRVQVRKFVFAGIIVALLVGTLASVIANRITLGR